MVNVYWYEGHFMSPRVAYCMYLYTHQWVHGCKAYLVHIPIVTNTGKSRTYRVHIYPGIFGAYSSYTPSMENQKCVYCRIWWTPTLENCLVVRTDGHFMVARILYFAYGKLWVLGSKGYWVHIAPIPQYRHIRNRHMAKFAVPLFPQTAA